MKKTMFAAALLVTGMLATAQAADRPRIPEIETSGLKSSKHWFVGQVQTGYYRGVGLHVSGTFNNFAEDFPFSVRLGLGYTRVGGSDAWAARRVFINNATNGTARSNARVWDARLDVMYPIKLFNLKRTKLFAGPRHSDFDTYFEYIGGAETFDVKAQQWGFGGGVETSFALSPRVDMVFTGGADYYFRATLAGHDTYYRPNGDDTHPIDDYTYKDADAAINQPDVMTRFMVGVAYHF
jgi:hypothetical protein